MKVDPFDLQRPASVRASALHKEARIQYIETTPSEGYRDKLRRCYCEIRYRDRIWCGAAIANPADEYSKYKGWMLASTRAAQAVARELHFPLEKYVSFIKKNTRYQALRGGFIQPTAWEKEHYKELFQNAEGEPK